MLDFDGGLRKFYRAVLFSAFMVGWCVRGILAEGVILLEDPAEWRWLALWFAVNCVVLAVSLHSLRKVRRAVGLR